MIEKVRSVHLIKSYGGQGRKYLEVPKLKYMAVQKCGTKRETNTNLI